MRPLAPGDPWGAEMEPEGVYKGQATSTDVYLFTLHRYRWVLQSADPNRPTVVLVVTRRSGYETSFRIWSSESRVSIQSIVWVGASVCRL